MSRPARVAYAQVRNVPARRLIALPDAIDDVQAAGMVLKGLTAQYLLRRTYRVAPGDTVRIHATAGGIGLILCQWAKHLRATVIGTVSAEGKAAQARAHGCDHGIVYTRENFLPKVRELTVARACRWSTNRSARIPSSARSTAATLLSSMYCGPGTTGISLLTHFLGANRCGRARGVNGARLTRCPLPGAARVIRS